MPSPTQILRDLRGASRLATDAVTGLTSVVEAMHAHIARVPGRRPPADGRTRGITGLVYRTVRTVTQTVGDGLDWTLRGLEPAGPVGESTPGREAWLAALNGVLGDRLDAQRNPLAIPMRLRVQGRALDLAVGDEGPQAREALAAALPQARGRVLVLLHGLCMNDLQWARDGADFGAALAQDLDATVLHLHHNTGRHVSVNGADMAALMETLVSVWPVPLTQIDLLAHSMGGLVARSALHQAQTQGLTWPARVRHLVCLGTPHHGAPLERGGHRIDRWMLLTPYTAPLARLGQVRSAGITDLRHGDLLGRDRTGRDRQAQGRDTRQPVPLPAGVVCHAVAGRVGDRKRPLRGQVLGDGLVPLDSALGRHREARHRLAFAPENQWVAENTGHMALQTSPAVYERVRAWLTEAD